MRTDAAWCPAALLRDCVLDAMAKTWGQQASEFEDVPDTENEGAWPVGQASGRRSLSVFVKEIEE